jgi:hypothetical protein
VQRAPVRSVGELMGRTGESQEHGTWSPEQIELAIAWLTLFQAGESKPLPHDNWIPVALDALRAFQPTAEPVVDRILWNERDGDIDEIVLHNATVHVEQMSARCWWIGVYQDGPDRYWMGNFTCDSRGRMKFTEQENAGIQWAIDNSHGERAIRRGARRAEGPQSGREVAEADQ